VEETDLEMARRHARQGLDRIERQKRLIALLIEGGHTVMALDAIRLLVSLQQFQADAEPRVARLEKRR
jgi:hypothetical protein